MKLLMPFLDRRENPRGKLIRLIGVRVEKLGKGVIWGKGQGPTAPALPPNPHPNPHKGGGQAGFLAPASWDSPF